MKLQEASLIKGVKSLLHPNTNLFPFSRKPTTLQNYDPKQDVEYEKIKSKENSKFGLLKKLTKEFETIDVYTNKKDELSAKNIFKLKKTLITDKEMRNDIKRIFGDIE